MRQKWKLGCWWFVLIPIVLVILFVVQLVGPNPTIIVSPQTTHIVAPLGPDGFPDYVGHLQRRGRTGVSQESNAAVPIWQATWPGELRLEHHQMVCDALGKEIPSAADSLLNIYDESVLEQIDAMVPEANGAVTAVEVVQMALRSGWTPEQLPLLRAWAESNRAPLDLLVEGAHRPDYYSPSPSFLDRSDEGVVSILLPGVQGLRDAASCLIARAMWYVGEARPAEAWRDLQATHLIARHACRGAFLVERLVGVAIESMACTGTQTLLHHGDLSCEQARVILADPEALPKLPPMSTAIDEGERLMFLDATMRLATGKFNGSDLQNFGVPNNMMPMIVATRIDWNVVL